MKRKTAVHHALSNVFANDLHVLVVVCDGVDLEGWHAFAGDVEHATCPRCKVRKPGEPVQVVVYDRRGLGPADSTRFHRVRL